MTSVAKSAAWVSAAEASRLLSVGRTTLYAYVSRGYIRSQPAGGASRERRYAREDIDRLKRRTEARRDPAVVTSRVLDWGLPVLESSIAFIDGRHLYYRGHDAVALSQSRTVAEVASLVWTGGFDQAEAFEAAARVPGELKGDGTSLSFVPRAQVRLAEEGAGDPRAFDLRPAAVLRAGWRILQRLTDLAAGSSGRGAADGRLARAWRCDDAGTALIRAALILCADHELNVSSFTARAVASAGAHPYAVVIAGLSALEGTRHGGASARVESMLGSLRRTRAIAPALADRLRRGESVDGFGHPLYREGDPRATALLGQLRHAYPRSAELRFILEVAAATSDAMQERPNLDFALAAVARVLRLPAGSALTLFAIGRSVGWIGHALEQYSSGQLIRPRARYVGVVPGATPSRGARSDPALTPV